MQRVWMVHYKTIMVEAINKILNEEPVKVQRHLKGSYYGKLREEQCYINTQGNVREAYNLVRGLSLPYFGARYENLIIDGAHIAKYDEYLDR